MKPTTPRWLLMVEGLLLLCSFLFLAYRAAMWIRPLGEVRQRMPPKADPFEVVRGYYRDFPDRYLRVDRESWRFDFSKGGARHALVLRNTATVSYRSIRLRFRYESAAGTELQSREVSLPETLAPGKLLELPDLFVADVPPQAERVVTLVAGAEIVR